jgi:hypothetical protein
LLLPLENEGMERADPTSNAAKVIDATITTKRTVITLEDGKVVRKILVPSDCVIVFALEFLSFVF